jgi:tetratricopeptide (TPR) repeat protein
VAGPAFDVELVRQMSGWSESQVLDSLDELLDQQVVREAIIGSRFDYTFTHDLIQSTIYEAIPPSSRKRRHRRVAHILEAYRPVQSEELVAELAVHFDRGEEPERAAAYYLKAAGRALAVFADKEALSALSRALELIADPQLRFELLGQREEIWHRQGERDAQNADLTGLEELAHAAGAEDWICEILRRQIRYWRALGDRQAEGELVAALKGRAVASGEKRWQAEALRAEATYQILLSQYDAASERLADALRLFQSADDTRAQIACYCGLIEIATQRSRFDEAQDLLQAAQLLAEVSADKSLLVGPLRTASGVAFARQEYETCLVLARQMLDLCRRIGDREGEADALSRLGTSLARLFRVQEARQSYEQAAALYDRLGKRQGQAAVRLNAGILAMNVGRYDEAIASFQQAGELFAWMDDRRGQMLSALNLSAAAIYWEDYPNASEAAQRSLELARQIQIPIVEAVALGNLGECHFYLGDVEHAIQYLEAALALRRERSLPPGDSASDLSVLARAYLKAGHKEKARQTAGKLLALCESKPESISYPQQALWAIAQVDATLGDRQRARELLEQAYAIVQQKTMTIPDPESKAAFLQLSYNREVLQAYENGLLS